MSSTKELQAIYNTENAEFNNNTVYKGFPTVDKEIASLYMIDESLKDKYCWPKHMDDGWNIYLDTNYFVTTDGIEKKVQVVKPGTRPTFGSHYVWSNSDFLRNDNFYSVGCLAYRTVTDASPVEITLTREKDQIKVTNCITRDASKSGTVTKGTGTTIINKNIKTCNNSPSWKTAPRPVFQDGTLPTRLLILLQGTGGGGAGGNSGWDSGSGGGGGGSGPYWLGVVKFDEGTTITIHLGKGGSGGALETNGSKGDDSWIAHSEAKKHLGSDVILTLHGGDGGTRTSGGTGGDISYLEAAKDKFYWTIMTTNGYSGGAPTSNGIASVLFDKYQKGTRRTHKLRCSQAFSADIAGDGYVGLSAGFNKGGNGDKGGGGGASLLWTGGNGGSGLGDNRNGEDAAKGAGGGGGGDKATFGGGSGTKRGVGGKGGDGAVIIWG